MEFESIINISQQPRVPSYDAYGSILNCFKNCMHNYDACHKKGPSIQVNHEFLVGLQSNSGLWIDDVRLSVNILVNLCVEVCSRSHLSVQTWYLAFE